MNNSPEKRPPLPPFDPESAAQKVRLAEDAWNTRDPERVSMAYTEDRVWRNRAEFLTGRDAIVEFLTRKWATELHYRLMKELWAYSENRISVRFEYEWQHAKTGRDKCLFPFRIPPPRNQVLPRRIFEGQFLEAKSAQDRLRAS